MRNINEPYSQYLQSDHWQNVRKMRNKLDDNKCVVCGRPFDTEVHHLNYENKDEERMEDLITLCRHHHQLLTNYNKCIKGSSRYYPSKMKQLSFLFCLKYKDEDRAIKGGHGMNLTDLDVLHAEAMKFNKSLYQDIDRLCFMDIQGYFRDLRIDKIVKLKQQGADNTWILGHYAFSPMMVSKYSANHHNQRYSAIYNFLKTQED